MSGGTWDYRDRCVRDLADDIRVGHARWHDDDSETLDLDAARGFMADILTVAADLLHELDWHFAGDSLIPNEGDWLVSARGRLHDIVSTEWGGVQDRHPMAGDIVSDISTLTVHDSVKMLRETLCVAQAAVARLRLRDQRIEEHLDRLQRLIDECDRHRPLGPDGKHGNLHTPTCGCEDKTATPAPKPDLHCPGSVRLHSWKLDGDDPYLICHWCGEVCDALTGRVIKAGA